MSLLGTADYIASLHELGHIGKLGLLYMHHYMGWAVSGSYQWSSRDVLGNKSCSFSWFNRWYSGVHIGSYCRWSRIRYGIRYIVTKLHNLQHILVFRSVEVIKIHKMTCLELWMRGWKGIHGEVFKQGHSGVNVLYWFVMSWSERKAI
jgi:hypothetical protein